MKGKSIYLHAILIRNIFKNLLASVSIALGITIFVATSVSAVSTKHFYNDYIGNRQSSADLIAIPKEGVSSGISPQTVKGIKAVLPYTENECYMNFDGDLSSLTKISVNPRDEIKQGSLILLEGNLPHDNECLITKTVKQMYKLSIGQKIEIRTVDGDKHYSISGIVQNSGIVLKNSAQCIVTNINESSSTPSEYKITLTDEENEALKKQVISMLKRDYIVQDAGANRNSFDVEINSFFNIFYIVSFLALGIGYYLVAVTINKYMFVLKTRFAILKVLGWINIDIYILIGRLGAFICGFGAVIGLGAGTTVSKVMLKIVANLLGLDKIPMNFPVQSVVGGISGCILFGVVISCILAHRHAGESIIDGLQKYPEYQKKLNPKYTYALGVICIICILSAKLLKNSTALNIVLQAVSLLSFISVVTRLFFRNYVLLLVSNFPIVKDSCRILAKSSLLKNLKNNLRTIALYISMIILVVAVSCTFSQFKNALDKMVDSSYFGDAVVGSVVGAAITIPDLNEINSLPQVQEVYPLYETYINIDALNVQINGYRLDHTNKEHLIKFLGMNAATLKLLNEKNTIALSDFVMKKENLEIGKSINVNGSEFKIVGRYSSMNNDGKSGIINTTNFSSTIENYKIEYINILLQDKRSMSEFMKEFKNKIKDPYIEVKNIDEMKVMEKGNNNQIIYLLNGIVVIVILSTVLMLTNSIVFELYNNIYTLSALKALGCSKSMLVQQQLLSACVKGLFASLLGVILSVPVNYSLVRMLNKALDWDITFNFRWNDYFGFGAMFLILMVFSEVVAIMMIYSKISVLEAVNGE